MHKLFSINVFSNLSLKLISNAFRHYKTISQPEIVILIRQLATLISAGIPLLTCFEILEQSQPGQQLRLLIHSIKCDLLTGKDLFSCLRRHHTHFNDLICQLIKIGEYTGKLDFMLQHIADEQEKSLAFKKQIQQALIYPCLILATAILITLSLFFFIIPRFAELFSATQTHLPLITRWLFFTSGFCVSHPFVILFLPIVSITIFFIPHPKMKPLKTVVVRELLRLPFIHHFNQKIISARFARNLSVTFAAGLPILDALKLIHLSHPSLRSAPWMVTLRSQLNSGMQLHQAMRSHTQFPLLMVQMVKIGEESGQPEQMLTKAADFLESEIHQWIRQFCHLLEPLIMLVLGVLIGGLVIGMYLPLFNLGNLL